MKKKTIIKKVKGVCEDCYFYSGNPLHCTKKDVCATVPEQIYKSFGERNVIICGEIVYEEVPTAGYSHKKLGRIIK